MSRPMFADIDECIAYITTQLLSKEPFYGYCLTGMVKIIDPELPFPAGVSIKNATINLFINPVTFGKFSLGEMLAVLKHEVIHLLFSHIPRAAERERMIWNIAADIATNQYIKGIPENACTYEKFNLPPELSAEQYYDKLLQTAKTISVASGGEGGDDKDEGRFDDHGAWENSDQEEIQSEVVKAMAQSANECSRGNVPSELAAILPKIFAVPIIPWPAILRMFVASLGKMFRSPTWKKQSRRFPDTPGNRRLPRLNLAVCIDTSGSVSDEQLAAFYVEVNAIHADKRNIVTVVECDAAVHAVYEYSGTPAKVTGRGGTAFTPALECVEKMYPRVDGLVYLTDGYGDNPEKCTNVPTLWVVTPGGNLTCARFGRFLKMGGKE